MTCAGCAAKDKHREGKKKPPPGVKVFTVDTRPPDHQLQPWSAASGAQADQDADQDQPDAE